MIGHHHGKRLGQQEYAFGAGREVAIEVILYHMLRRPTAWLWSG
ncbi:hypothetical protein [Jannaschia sp. CCS1]|nr:hypothetical protein [Jannaschia sp. CCS1]